jgi:tRNA pseudouridine13 synthase
VRLLEASRHDNKLRTGHLAGNRFAIRLVGAEVEVALLTARAEALCSALTQTGLLNFFGAQRFGIGGQNLARALSWVRRGARGKNRFESKLFPSVIQSEVFNRYLALRAERGLGQLLAGEVVRLEGSGASFLVTDRDKEQPRLEQRDIHLLGPMFGPKMKPAEAAAAELERAAFAAAGIDDDVVRRLERLAPGTRRDLVVPVLGLGFSVEGPGQGVLSFSLPAGSYATQLLREFTRQGFFEDLRSLLDG